MEGKRPLGGESPEGEPKRLRTEEDQPAAGDDEPAAGDDVPAVSEDEPAASEAGEAEEESSSSSSDSESSSSSSDSESESGGGEKASGDGAAVVDEPPEVRDRRQLELLRNAQLKKEDLIAWLTRLPDTEYVKAIIQGFVRLRIESKDPEQPTKWVIAEVTGLEDCASYKLQPLDSSNTVHLNLQLRVKRGQVEKLIKVTAASDQDFEEPEFKQWKTLLARNGILDIESYYKDTMVKKAQDYAHARNYSLTKLDVEKIRASRPPLEFLAQQESHLKFQAQSLRTQMEISGIRDTPAKELEDQYQQVMQKQYQLEIRAGQVQQEWFDRRPDLYSINEINRKNLLRQVADDKRALAYALKNEAEGTAALNPFQRRDCRPVCAWDTKLTPGEGQQAQGAAAQGDAAPPAPAETPAQAAPSGDSTAAQEAAEAPAAGQESLSRLDCFLQAHQRVNIFEQLEALGLGITA